MVDLKKVIRIYQMQHVEETDRRFHHIRYRIFWDLEEDVNTIDFVEDNYKVVYAIENVGQKLDDIFRMFNIERPQDFKGHSLSISDIVEMNGKFYRCQGCGWKEVELLNITN